MKEKAILIACDHAGFSLKEILKSYLARLGFEVKDLGTYSKERCDYPCFSAALAAEISRGTYKRGILICKTGIGSSIVANRFPGVRASVCFNLKSARLTREHNDSNVLVLGAAFVRGADARRIVHTWINTRFLGGRHARRLSQIKTIEREIRGKRL
jgi:ribose 5-phosphate isomerase B